MVQEDTAENLGLSHRTR